MTTVAATANGKAKTNKVSGVLVDQIDGEHLRSVLKKLKIPHDVKLSDEKLTVVLREYFEKTVAHDDLVQCDVCQGISDLALDACPYCATREAASESEEDEAKENPEEEEDAEAEGTGEDDVEEPESEGPPPATALARTRGAKAPPAGLATKSEKDLDEAVRDVHALKGKSAESMWKLGRRIGDIYDDNLWKQRLDDRGKQRWKSFEAFCNLELGLVPQNALKLVDVSKEFTVEQVGHFGTSKLGLVLQAPKEDQPKLLERAAKGATKRALEQEVRRIKREKGHRRSAREGASAQGKAAAKAGAKATQASAKSRAKKTITVANITGRQVVKLYEKPTTKSPDVSTLKRAKALTDQPWGQHELTNGVVQEFFVQKSPSGELQLVVATKRVDEG